MSEIKGTETERNLLSAYLGECRDYATYLFYAKTAKKEGYIRVSRIFEETAAHELSHAKSFLKHLGTTAVEAAAPLSAMGLGKTAESLRLAVQGEAGESERLYPGFADTAEKEGFQKIAVLFRSIAKAEGFHRSRFQGLLDDIETDTMFRRDESVTWVCSKCGYVYEGKEPLPKCPACGHPREYFEVLRSG